MYSIWIIIIYKTFRNSEESDKGKYDTLDDREKALKKKEEELKSREDEETRRQVWNSSIGLGFLRKTYRLRCCEVTSFCMQSKKANGREEREGKNIILAVCTDLLIKTFSLMPLSLPLTFVSLVRFFNCMQNGVTSQRLSLKVFLKNHRPVLRELYGMENV